MRWLSFPYHDVSSSLAEAYIYLQKSKKNETASDLKAEKKKKTKKKKEKVLTVQTKPNVENDIDPVGTTDTNRKDKNNQKRDKNKKDKFKQKKGKGVLLEKTKAVIEDINATLKLNQQWNLTKEERGKKGKRKMVINLFLF